MVLAMLKRLNVLHTAIMYKATRHGTRQRRPPIAIPARPVKNKMSSIELDPIRRRESWLLDHLAQPRDLLVLLEHEALQLLRHLQLPLKHRLDVLRDDLERLLSVDGVAVARRVDE